MWIMENRKSEKKKKDSKFHSIQTTFMEYELDHEKQDIKGGNAFRNSE